MSKKYKVNFIACTYNQLSNQNKVKGNLIAIMDRSEAYYDLPSGAPGTPLETEVTKELSESVRSDLISTYEYKEMSVDITGLYGDDINLQMIPIVDSEEQDPVNITGYIDSSNRVDISEYDNIILICTNTFEDPQEVKLTLINEDVIDEHIVRRKLAGVGSGSELPEPIEVLGSNKLHGDPEYFIVFNSETVDNGLYAWDPSGGDDNLGAYQLIAEIDSGKVTVDTQDDKLYLTGIKTDDPQGKVQLQVSPVYIHPTTHAIVGNLNGRASRATKADSATNATNATNAEKATKDDIDQEIKVTYIKNVEVDGRDIVTTKGDGTTQTQTVSEARYYQQLPFMCDLDDITEPGLYYGVSDNLITNRPEDVNGFGLDVYFTDKIQLDTDTSYEKIHTCVCQELHSSGIPWNVDNVDGYSITKIELTPTAMLDGELKITFYDGVSDGSVDKLDIYAGYFRYNMWDNIMLEYVESGKHKLISLRDAITNVEYTGEDAFYLSSSADTNSFAICIPGSIFNSLSKLYILPKTDFPTHFSPTDKYMKYMNDTFSKDIVSYINTGCMVNPVDIDYPEQTISYITYSGTEITSNYPSILKTTSQDNCNLGYLSIGQGSSDFYLLLSNFSAGVGTSNYKVKVNDNWIPNNGLVVQYHDYKAIKFDYTKLLNNINRIKVYSVSASDPSDITLQGECVVINSDSDLPERSENVSKEDFIRKCINGKWTDWEDAHGVSYKNIYIP